MSIYMMGWDSTPIIWDWILPCQTVCTSLRSQKGVKQMPHEWTQCVHGHCYFSAWDTIRLIPSLSPQSDSFITVHRIFFIEIFLHIAAWWKHFLPNSLCLKTCVYNMFFQFMHCGFLSSKSAIVCSFQPYTVTLKWLMDNEVPLKEIGMCSINVKKLMFLVSSKHCNIFVNGGNILAA